MQAVELPLPALLERVGLAWDGSRIIEHPGATPSARALGQAWPMAR